MIYVYDVGFSYAVELTIRMDGSAPMNNVPNDEPIAAMAAESVRQGAPSGARRNTWRTLERTARRVLDEGSTAWLQKKKIDGFVSGCIFTKIRLCAIICFLLRWLR